MHKLERVAVGIIFLWRLTSLQMRMLTELPANVKDEQSTAVGYWSLPGAGQPKGAQCRRSDYRN